MLTRRAALVGLAGAAAALSAPRIAARAAAPIRAAVAANFRETFDALAQAFEARGGPPVDVVAGSTGQLFAQIVNGAPVDVFFAADAARPRRLVEMGRATAQARYARGVLALYADEPDRALGPEAFGPEALAASELRLAMANPRTAPYGRAALAVLEALGRRDALAGRIAMARNVSGAYAAVRSGAVDLGFVALSALRSPANSAQGSVWLPPREMYGDLEQDVALLSRGADKPAAQALLDFVAAPEARAIIARFGYELA